MSQPTEAAKDPTAEKSAFVSSRFSYVQYNPKSAAVQAGFKLACENLEEAVVAIGSGRSQSLALTALEEFYMWVGKALRDEQIKREPAVPQEQRNNS